MASGPRKAVYLLITLALLSCGDDQASTECTPLDSAACTCVDGSSGHKTCGSGGEWLGCVCDTGEEGGNEAIERQDEAEPGDANDEPTQEAVPEQDADGPGEDAGDVPDAADFMPDAENAFPEPDPVADPAEEEGLPDGESGDLPGFTCKYIGESYSDGFFTLESFKGKLYAGLFGYGHESQSMMYSYPPWKLTSPGLLGVSESVCALHEFNGMFYANTESSGDVFRSTDGSNWTKVFDGDNGSIGCGLAVLGNAIYALNYRNQVKDHGRILRSQDGAAWSTVFDSGQESLYLRELVTFGGRLYAFGVNQSTGSMYVLVSSNGTTWERKDAPVRFFRAHVWNGYLWLGSTDRRGTDQGVPGKVGVWRFDGDTFELVHEAGAAHYVADLQDAHGALFASTSNGWKEDSGPSFLLVSQNGVDGWKQVCRFQETAAWNMAVLDGELYVGTWQYGAKGKVYKVVEADDQEPVDCSGIADVAAYELCETGTDYCAGVFTDGSGCAAYCAAAGLVCKARYGGGEGCSKEPQNPWPCDANNGHQSDWCECVRDSNNGGGDCEARAGSLSVGETYTVQVDSHTGDEAGTQPKTDANDGRNGDNPRFRRHNVARAHNDYWYTSSHQEAGEPNPAGEQWVDYKPDFNGLGTGCYKITAQYRATENRATYPVLYQVRNSKGVVANYSRVQNRGSGEYRDEDLGNHFMCTDSYVRIEDPGTGSISFNKMR
ncbi:MAG: hypothetical protein GXP49_05730, partial [Deltaproteobacteria bacterium]|nr:hypothetical protein [Deltaproteobacteria bacterium]